MSHPYSEDFVKQAAFYPNDFDKIKDEIVRLSLKLRDRLVEVVEPSRIRELEELDRAINKYYRVKEFLGR